MNIQPLTTGHDAPKSAADTMQTSTQSAGSAEKLPIELIHHIVACLDDRLYDHYNEELDDRRRIPLGLTACSLVCRSWNHICRAHIFHAVALNHGQEVFTQRLSFLHFTAPHLYKNIRNLNIFLEGDPRTFVEWIPDCISRFTNLSALRLDAELITGAVLDILSTLGIMSLLSTSRLKQLDLDLWGVDEGTLDLIPILSACSTTLESLSLEIYEVYERVEISEETGSESSTPSSVYLGALRNLKMIESICRLPPTNLIKCPNLESLTVECFSDDGNWGIPSWIPASLSELILHVGLSADIPYLGTSIRPSALTISIYRPTNASLLDVMTWIGGCISHLPDPSGLRQLTVVINGHHSNLNDWGGPLYPEVTDYEALCRVIQPLCTRGGLNQIHLNITADKNGTATGPVAHSSAVVAVERAFAPILEEILAVGGFQRIICNRGKVDVLLIKNLVEIIDNDGRFIV